MPLGHGMASYGHFPISCSNGHHSYLLSPTTSPRRRYIPAARRRRSRSFTFSTWRSTFTLLHAQSLRPSSACLQSERQGLRRSKFKRKAWCFPRQIVSCQSCACMLTSSECGFMLIQKPVTWLSSPICRMNRTSSKSKSSTLWTNWSIQGTNCAST